MMKTAARLLTVLLTMISTAGCDQASAPSTASAEQSVAADAEYALPDFVGKVWISTTPGSPRGSIRVFLPNKTLLIDSCFETFRVEKWGIVGEDRIRWLEDSIPIEAKYEQPRADSLRLQIAGISEAESYTTVSPPYLCPEMPR